jgi:hypothetical protein
VGLGDREIPRELLRKLTGQSPGTPAPALRFVAEVKIKIKVNPEGKNEGGQNGSVLRLDGHRIFTWA